MFVAAAARTWEAPRPALISWFPAGAAATAVAIPAPGTTITPQSPITLTFSKTVEQALGAAAAGRADHAGGLAQRQFAHDRVQT